MDKAQDTGSNPSARDALVLAAIDAFGHDGFDAVSIRRIADAAGANTALISYYFGGKEGLYGAAVQHIADQIGERMNPVAEQLERELAALGEEPDASSCARLVHRIIDALLDTLVRPETSAWARIILREQQDPSPHFQTLYGGVMSRVLRLCVRLVCRARGGRNPGPTDQLTAMSLLAQVVFFRTNHAAVLQAMGWTEIGDEQRNAIRAVVHDNVTRILGVDA